MSLKMLRNSFISLLILLVVLIFCSCRQREAPETTPSDNAIVFHGKVLRGERFIHKLSESLTFELAPIDYGWEIAVRIAERPDENIARLTPPFHSVPNPRFIEGWHFRNADNTGPNEAGPKNVNAPQEVREFIFSREVGSTIHYPPSSDDIDEISKDGHGTLTITELQLGNLEPGQKAHIEAMEFSAEIYIAQ